MEFTKKDILVWLDQHERIAELNAENSFSQRKYMMFGHWKAIGLHIRKMKREIKDWEKTKMLFPGLREEGK